MWISVLINTDTQVLTSSPCSVDHYSCSCCELCSVIKWYRRRGLGGNFMSTSTSTYASIRPIPNTGIGQILDTGIGQILETGIGVLHPQLKIFNIEKSILSKAVKW